MLFFRKSVQLPLYKNSQKHREILADMYSNFCCSWIKSNPSYQPYISIHSILLLALGQPLSGSCGLQTKSVSNSVYRQSDQTTSGGGLKIEKNWCIFFFVKIQFSITIFELIDPIVQTSDKSGFQNQPKNGFKVS